MKKLGCREKTLNWNPAPLPVSLCLLFLPRCEQAASPLLLLQPQAAPTAMPSLHRWTERITNTDLLKWCIKLSLGYVYEVSMKRNLNFVFWLGSHAPITYLTMRIQIFPKFQTKTKPQPQWSCAFWLRDAQPVSCLLPRDSRCILEPTHHLAETFLITKPQEFHVGFHVDRVGVGADCLKQCHVSS